MQRIYIYIIYIMTDLISVKYIDEGIHTIKVIRGNTGEYEELQFNFYQILVWDGDGYTMLIMNLA